MIPLEDINNNNNNIGIDEDVRHWTKEYTKLMDTTVSAVSGWLREDDWTVCCDRPNDVDTIIMYERCPMLGFYTFKIHATLPGIRAERLMYVIRDFGSKTGTDDILMDRAVLETFDIKGETTTQEIRYVSALANLETALLKQRSIMGIDWKGFNTETGMYSYIFRTTQHRKHRCDEKKYVPIDVTVGAFARYIDKKSKTELIMIVRFNPGDNILSSTVNYHKVHLIEQIESYAKAVREWK